MEANLNDYTRIKIELDISAQKVLHQFITHNENLNSQIEAGLKAAVENFNVQDHIEKQTSIAIREVINDSFSYGKLAQLVRAKINPVIEAFIEKEMAKYKLDAGEGA